MITNERITAMQSALETDIVSVQREIDQGHTLYPKGLRKTCEDLGLAITAAQIQRQHFKAGIEHDLNDPGLGGDPQGRLSEMNHEIEAAEIMLARGRRTAEEADRVYRFLVLTGKTL